MIALIASSANFGELTEAPIYIIAGLVILGVQAIVMVILAKIFKLDLFTCCIASSANIGGVASSPVIAGAYNDRGSNGYVTIVGLGIMMAKVLYLLV